MLDPIDWVSSSILPTLLVSDLGLGFRVLHVLGVDSNNKGKNVEVVAKPDEEDTIKHNGIGGVEGVEGEKWWMRSHRLIFPFIQSLCNVRVLDEWQGKDDGKSREKKEINWRGEEERIEQPTPK